MYEVTINSINYEYLTDDYEDATLKAGKLFDKYDKKLPILIVYYDDSISDTDGLCIFGLHPDYNDPQRGGASSGAL